MKKHLSLIVFGCLALFVVITLYSVYLVLPEHATKMATLPQGQTRQQNAIAITLAGDGNLYLTGTGQRLDSSQLAKMLHDGRPSSSVPKRE